MKGSLGQEASSALDGQALGIGKLADMFGITQRAIRFYENQGLLAPKRVGKTRIFGDRDRVRLQFILRGKRLGFSLADIRDWLDLYDMEDGERRQYQALLCESRRRILDLERQRDDLEEMLKELKSIEALAVKKIDDADQSGPAVSGGDNQQRHQQRPPAASGQTGQMK